MHKEITITQGELRLSGHLSGGDNDKGWVIFAHGSGSSRLSSRNNWVAQKLNDLGYGTLLFDLLTPSEDLDYDNRFNLPLLSRRLALATGWLLRSPYYHGQPIAFFGASTGAGAALVAASDAPAHWPLFGVISRGGRPDLAGQTALRNVAVPVLLIVGGEDHDVITLNKMAQVHLRNPELRIVEGATHLFEEPGKLGEVVRLSSEWLDSHLGEARFRRPGGNLDVREVRP